MVQRTPVAEMVSLSGNRATPRIYPSFMIFRKNPKNALCKMETRKPSGKKKKRETPLLDH
jgi:hypothetical protein